jgi:hypothetical protein
VAGAVVAVGDAVGRALVGVGDAGARHATMPISRALTTKVLDRYLLFKTSSLILGSRSVLLYIQCNTATST